jgi:hypothetical protein
MRVRNGQRRPRYHLARGVVLLDDAGAVSASD